MDAPAGRPCPSPTQAAAPQRAAPRERPGPWAEYPTTTMACPSGARHLTCVRSRSTRQPWRMASASKSHSAGAQTRLTIAALGAHPMPGRGRPRVGYARDTDPAGDERACPREFDAAPRTGYTSSTETVSPATAWLRRVAYARTRRGCRPATPRRCERPGRPHRFLRTAASAQSSPARGATAQRDGQLLGLLGIKRDVQTRIAARCYASRYISGRASRWRH
jgi:hypothetical protein